MKKLIIVDGNSIFHRAYHALPPMKNEKGESINAVLGFSSMIINVLIKEKPEYALVCFDKKGKTIRHETYPEYKATRKKAPDDLYAQFPMAKEFLFSFSIPIFEEEGFEADDLIATCSKQAEQMHDLQTLILTADRDALQLISERTKVLAPIKGVSEMIEFDREMVLKKYNITPEQITDYKGLFGDNSDNIKGVPGVGKVTAQKLLSEYGSIENIFNNISKIGGSLQKKLLENKENALMSKAIGTLITEAPIRFSIEDSKISEFDEERFRDFLTKYNFKSLARRSDQLISIYNKKKNEEKFVQNPLFE